MGEENLNKCYEVILSLVEQAGKIIAERNSERKSFITKSSNIDLLTETDQEVEQLIVNGLTKEFPHHKFIGEEGQSCDGAKCELTDAPTWIIDPVDGTMNFVHSFPHSCVSVGLLVNRVAEIGVVYNPILNQKFTARRGQGAYYNGTRIQVSGEREVAKALVTTEFGTSRDAEKLKVTMENLTKVVSEVQGVRSLGSAALNMCMVALGAADCNYEFGIHAWDVAAGDIIVREAGGVTFDPAGGPLDLMSRRVLAASSPQLADELIKCLKQFYPQPRDDN